MQTDSILNISFSGADDQCQAFIDHVTEYSFENDKQFDDAWIARFAGTRLRGPALLWFLSLEEGQCNSWDQLRRALALKYLPNARGVSTDVTSYHEVPTATNSPAAAPSLVRSLAPPALNVKGRIKVLAEDSIFSGYLSKDTNTTGWMLRTARKEDAVAVECNLSDKAVGIKLSGMLNTPVSWLAIHWDNAQPTVTANSSSVGRIVNILQSDSGQISSPSKGSKGPINTAPWLILLNGTITPVHQNKDGSFLRLDYFTRKLQWRHVSVTCAFGALLEELDAHVVSDFSLVKLVLEPF